MTTNKINSIKKVRTLLETETDVYNLAHYYQIVEKLLYHYKRVLNKAKEMEATRLLTKIKITIIERMTIA